LLHDLYPYFFYYSWFCAFCALLQNSSLQVQNMWLEDILRPCGSKKIEKSGPKWPNISKARRPEQVQNVAFGKREKHPGQPPPRALFTTGRAGGGTAVLSGTHGHASPYPQFAFFLCGFSACCAILSVLAVVLSLKEHVSRPIWGIIHHTIVILLLLDFSLD